MKTMGASMSAVRLSGFVLGDDLAAVGEVDGLAAGGNEGEIGFVFDGVNGDEGDLLEPGSFVAGGFEAVQFELGGDVLGCELVAASAGAAAFKKIKGKEADVGAHLFRIDGSGGGAGRGRKAGDGRHVCV